MPRSLTLALALTLAAASAGAESLRLTPASPQPDPAALTPGLAVKYSFPGDVKWLHEAETWRRHAASQHAGRPLVGFDYPDTREGETVLTTDYVHNVIAFIDGYMLFDRAGTWRVEVMINDAIDLTIGGQQVIKVDGRNPCTGSGWQAVEIPEPGWYPLKATYFQRRGTSCLLMKWQAPGEAGLTWTPNEAFRHRS